ncbi:transferase family-domain-containing protein [Aspergillus foveolatus]|uniref:transferase family-domain-containing protein n=1 Tax=Aspergillus foveolatus TaxID=210207 RepID=UPI003CCDD4AC
MTIHDDFESFELTPADYCFPMFYTGCTVSFRLINPEKGLVVLRDAINRLVFHLPKPGVMEVRFSAQGEAKSGIFILRHVPHLRLPGKTDSTSQVNIDMYDRNAALITAPVHIAASPTDHPVMRFQINLLADGIILALFVNHMVIDGTGVGALLESLANCCNDTPCHPASTECELATREKLLATLARGRSREIPGAAGPGSPVLETITQTGHEDVHDSSLLDYNFFISGAKIKQLRGLIQNIEPEFVSEDDVLTAILWMRLGRLRSHQPSRGGPTASACMLQRVVNVRHRLSPRVPSHYLGNCFIMLNQTMTTAELGHKGPSDSQQSEEWFARQTAFVARALRDQLNNVDDRFVWSYLSQFSTANSWSNTSVHEPDVAVTSIRRLSVYEKDFGPVLGKVVDFEMLPYMNPEGVCTIKPRRRFNDDTWEVSVTLRREDMDRLRSDGMWRSLVSKEHPLRIFEAIM